MMTQSDQTLPTDNVIAVLNGEHAARAAQEDLKRRGFAKTSLLQSDDLTRSVDAHGSEGGLLTAVRRHIQEALSEEPKYLVQYEDLARSGHVIIAVEIDDKSRLDEVGEVLRGHGAVNARYFGALAVTDLMPETNPSAGEEVPREQ